MADDAPLSRRARRAAEREAAQDPMEFARGIATGEIPAIGADGKPMSRRERRRLERIIDPMEAWTEEEERAVTGQIPAITPEVIAEQERIAREKAAAAAAEAEAASRELQALAPQDTPPPREHAFPEPQQPGPQPQQAFPEVPEADPVSPQDFPPPPAVSEPAMTERLVEPEPQASVDEYAYSQPHEAAWAGEPEPAPTGEPEPTRPEERTLVEPYRPTFVGKAAEAYGDGPVPPTGLPDAVAQPAPAQEPDAAAVQSRAAEALVDEPSAPDHSAAADESAAADHPAPSGRGAVYDELFPPGSAQAKLLAQQEAEASAEPSPAEPFALTEAPWTAPEDEQTTADASPLSDPAEEIRRLTQEALGGLERARGPHDADQTQAPEPPVEPPVAPSQPAEIAQPSGPATPPQGLAARDEPPAGSGALPLPPWEDEAGDQPVDLTPPPQVDPTPAQPVWGQVQPSGGQPTSGQFPTSGQQPAARPGSPFPPVSPESHPLAQAPTQGPAQDPNNYEPVANVPTPDFSKLYRPPTGQFPTASSGPYETVTYSREIPQMEERKHSKWLYLSVVGALMFALGVVVYNAWLAG